jgi:hypothetical protein
MHLRLILLLVLFLNCSMFSCNTSSPENPLAGKWEIVEASGTLSDMNLGTIYQFGKESEFYTEKSGFRNVGHYVLSGDTLKISFGTLLITALISINDNKMDYAILNSDQKFQLKKK